MMHPMTRRVIRELADGLPNGPYGARWWEPDHERTRAAADRLFDVSVLYPGDAPFEQVVPVWGGALGIEVPETDPCGYGLLEATGMNAMQFCDFWWVIEHEPGYPTNETKGARFQRRLAQFAMRLVLDGIYPHAMHFVSGYGRVLDQAWALDVHPLVLPSMPFELDQSGIPRSIVGV